MKKNSLFRLMSILLKLNIMMIIIMITSCSYNPRWTPEKVKPPQSLESAMQKVDEAKTESSANLAGDKQTTVTLTRDGVLLAALARNRSLAIARYSPEISALGIDTALAAFDPTFSMSETYSHSSRESTSTDPVTGKTKDIYNQSQQYSGSASLRESLPTGTDLVLSGSYGQSRSYKPTKSEWQFSGSYSAELNQSLLKGAGIDVNLVNLRQANNNLAISLHGLRSFILDLVQQVESAYWDLALSNETLKIRQFAVKLSEEQLQMNKDLIAVGKLSPDAEIAAKAELDSRKADLVDAAANVKLRTINMIELLNPVSSQQWKTTFLLKDAAEVVKVDLSPEISAKLADLYRPDLAQSRLDLANRDLAVISSKNGLLPKLDAFGSYGRNSGGDQPKDITEDLNESSAENYKVGLNFETSLLYRSERAARKRADFEQKKAEESIKNLELSINGEIRNAVIEVEKQWAKIIAQQSLVKSRQEEFDVEQDRFRVGLSTNIDVLTVLNSLIQAQLSEVTARVNYIKSLTNLYHAEGTLLDRRSIGADTK